MFGSSLRQSAWVSLSAVVIVMPVDLPIGVEELLREPARAETRSITGDKCHHGTVKAITPKVSTTKVTAPAKTKRTTVAKSEKGFKLFRWLL